MLEKWRSLPLNECDSQCEAVFDGIFYVYVAICIAIALVSIGALRSYLPQTLSIADVILDYQTIILVSLAVQVAVFALIWTILQNPIKKKWCRHCR